MSIVNKVATSSLLSIDLEEWYPEKELMSIDIADQLIEGFLLREKDFREFIKENDWSRYEGKLVALFCSTDAIIPRWAWMLLSSALQKYASIIFFGTPEALVVEFYREKIDALDLIEYTDQRVVIKGCSKKPVPVQAYVHITSKLQSVVKSIFYGEPCSTVPVFKRAKA